MKFTDGYWHHRPEYTLLYAVDVDDIRIDTDRGELVVYASTARISGRGQPVGGPWPSSVAAASQRTDRRRSAWPSGTADRRVMA